MKKVSGLRNEVCSLLQKCKQKRRTRREQKESKGKLHLVTFFDLLRESLVHFLESEIRDALKNEVGNFD